jgi:hypothetical protein
MLLWKQRKSKSVVLPLSKREAKVKKDRFDIINILALNCKIVKQKAARKNSPNRFKI